MRRPVLLLVGLGVFAAAAGCQNCDLVEAELRSRNSQVHELQEELHRAEAYNTALQRELQDLRQNPSLKLSPELAAQTYTVQQVVLGRQTGGYMNGNGPGDDALQVVLQPRDPDGHDIKAPGALHVTALQVSPEGLKTPLSSWDLTPDQLRRTWRSGLFSTGYYVILPWKAWPSSSKLRVVAQFSLADGRAFEVDRDVTIHLATEAPHKPPLTPPDEGPGPHLPGPELPLPRRRARPDPCSHPGKATRWRLSPPPGGRPAKPGPCPERLRSCRHRRPDSSDGSRRLVSILRLICAASS